MGVQITVTFYLNIKKKGNQIYIRLNQKENYPKSWVINMDVCEDSVAHL